MQAPIRYHGAEGESADTDTSRQGSESGNDERIPTNSNFRPTPAPDQKSWNALPSLMILYGFECCSNSHFAYIFIRLFACSDDTRMRVGPAAPLLGGYWRFCSPPCAKTRGPQHHTKMRSGRLKWRQIALSANCETVDKYRFTHERHRVQIGHPGGARGLRWTAQDRSDLTLGSRIGHCT